LATLMPDKFRGRPEGLLKPDLVRLDVSVR
jgi:hypothetical protein